MNVHTWGEIAATRYVSEPQKCPKNAFATGALLRTPLESLQRSPDPLTGNGGGGPREGGGKGRGGEGRGEGIKGRDGKGREGEGEGLYPRTKILATALFWT